MTPTPSGASPKDERATQAAAHDNAILERGFQLGIYHERQRAQAEPAGEREATEPTQSSTVGAEMRPPSPTAGMTIAQRILHVGGRNNAAGYVEFGSTQAVEALVRQVLRDLPAESAAEAPDGAHEALQRLIENAAALGPASRDDARLVAKWRRPLLQARPAQPAAQGVGVAALSTSSTKPGEAHPWQLLSDIDTWACMLPTFKVAHEGGPEAAVANVIEAIQRATAALAAPEAPASTSSASCANDGQCHPGFCPCSEQKRASAAGGATP